MALVSVLVPFVVVRCGSRLVFGSAVEHAQSRLDNDPLLAF